MPSRILKVDHLTNPKRIIGFAGAKQSGKNSAANFTGGTLLWAYHYIESFQLTSTGIILDGVEKEINQVAPSFVKIYHWADALKEFVSNTFGIDIKLLYGTDQDKDQLTHLMWENMPNVMTDKALAASVNSHIFRKGSIIGANEQSRIFKVLHHEPGPMSVREVLQYFGSDVCRVMYQNCWVQALESRILAEKPAVVLIADTRFDNELEAVKGWGGKCVKLNRQIKKDKHKSENGISSFTDWDAVVPNEKTDTVREFCPVLSKALKPMGAFAEL